LPVPGKTGFRSKSGYWILSTEYWVLILYHFSVHPLAERLLKTIRKHEFLRAGDRMAVAVSGGADSVALFCLMLELRDDLGIVLSLAHVNHKLRGEESDEDQRFVAQLAEKHGIELHVCEAPVRGEDNSKINSGIEAAARHQRYDFFRRLTREKRVSKIATAHTLDDQAETVMLRIFRGTGIRGLSGIHPRIVFEEHGRLFGEVVRPLLDFRRATLQEFLRDREQDWREDSSNRDVTFLRNRVRHRLLPLITEAFGESAIEHLSELAEIARAEEEHWEQGHPEIAAQPEETDKKAADKPRSANQPGEVDDLTFVSGHRFSDAAKSSKSNAPLEAGHSTPKTRQAASLQRELLSKLSLAAQRRFLRGWLEANSSGLVISFRIIEEALELATGAAGRKLELPGGWILRAGRQELFLEPELRSSTEADYEYALAVPGVVDVPELGISVEAQIVDASHPSEDEREHLLDPCRLPNKILIRNWRAGDRYWPPHTSAPKKVKELLTDRHLTGTEKKLWPVAVAEGSGLIWMRGFAVPATLQPPAAAAKAILIRERRPCT
jgi:tRNA(Ile)-lysidine synthase